MFDAVPDEWRIGNLGNLVQEIAERTDPSQAAIGKDCYVGLEHIEQGTGHLCGFGRAADVVSQKSIFEPGDILYGKLRPNLRKVARPDFGGVCSTDIVVFRARDGADPDFAFSLLQSEPLVLHAVATAAGTKMPRTHARSILSFQALLPPLDEQRRIVKVLQSVDEALTAELSVLTQLHKTKTAALERFMAEALKSSSISLSEITTHMDAGWSPDCENIPALADEWAVLKTTAVTWAGYDDGQNKRLPISLEARASLAVKAGDILITRAGPTDRTGVVAIVGDTTGKRMLSDKLIRVRVNEEQAIPLTIAEILRSSFIQDQFGRAKSGMAASQTNISQKIVAGLTIPLPPLELQQQFANFAGSLNELIGVSNAQTQKLKRLKASLLSDLLSGRVRVPA